MADPPNASGGPGANNQSPTHPERRSARKQTSQNKSASLLATILIASLSASTISIVRLILPMIAASMGASATLVGVMGALIAGVPMLFSVGFGRWIDKGGPLLPMAFSCLLLLVGSVIFPLWASLPALLLVAGLFGAGATFSHITAVRAVGELGESARRIQNLGYLIAAYSSMQLIGPITVGFIYDYADANIALLTLGGSALLALLLIAFTRHNYRRIPKLVAPAAGRTRMLDLLKRTELRRWSLVSGVCSSAMSFMPFVVSLHLFRIGQTPAAAGVVLGAFALGAILSRLGLSLLVNRIAAPVILCCSLAMGALTYLVLPHMSELPGLIGVSVVLGFFLGLGVPVSLALLYEAAPKAQVNEAIGLCTALTNVMQTISPLALGLTSVGTGLAPVIGLIAAVMTVTALYSLRAPAT